MPQTGRIVTHSLLKMPPRSKAPQYAEVVCAGKDGVPDFDRLHGRCFDHLAVACAFYLLMLNDDDMRRKTFAERKAALRKLLKHEPNGIQYVEHIEGNGDAMFEAVCKLGLEGLVSKKLYAPYRSGPSKAGSRPRTRRPRQRYALSKGAFDRDRVQWRRGRNLGL